jgi:DNA-binding transcriptional MerR regulator/methylmalonyl-CoA mutase cobalamin-binding subunit
MMKEGYTIRTVAQLTGLSSHVIRAWERRYGAVTPARTEGNQRTYSEADISRLRLLARAVAAGSSISRVAGLSNNDLERFVSLSLEANMEPDDTSALLTAALDAVERLDPIALEDAVVRASIELGQIRAIENVIVPMMDEIGKRWHEGKLRIMHEHMASAVVRNILGSAFRAQETSPEDRGVVVAAPAGQSHELGALACAGTAASLGLRVTYLGAGVPADEIIAAVDQTRSVAVILSVVFPRSATRVREEVQLLRRHLPRHVRLIVGGASASQLDPEYSLRTMADLRGELARLQSAAGQANAS